ncbi:hypothetical protein INT45_006599 [Circinella minor]|uniref:Uncharacterized protein n=1 Tax=Circinella minor TaxID=1195481 RepID=A0A8H7SCC2_9FUNG|nr:hypothetical protein INT45_006599 [Circinella minor]
MLNKDCIRHQHQNYYARHDAAVQEKKLEHAQLDEAINKFLLNYPFSNYDSNSSTIATSSPGNKAGVRENSRTEYRNMVAITSTSPRRQNIKQRQHKDNKRKSVTFNNLIQLVMI